MTRSEFQDLQLRATTSGKTLKEFLKSEGVAYSTCNYWSKKTKSESAALPIAPISIRSESRQITDGHSLAGMQIP